MWEVWVELPLVLDCVKILSYITRESSTGKVLVLLFWLVTRVRGLHRTLLKIGVYCKNTHGKELKQEMEMLQTGTSVLSLSYAVLLCHLLFVFSHCQLIFPL